MNVDHAAADIVADVRAQRQLIEPACKIRPLRICQVSLRITATLNAACSISSAAHRRAPRVRLGSSRGSSRHAATTSISPTRPAPGTGNALSALGFRSASRAGRDGGVPVVGADGIRAAGRGRFTHAVPTSGGVLNRAGRMAAGSPAPTVNGASAAQADGSAGLRHAVGDPARGQNHRRAARLCRRRQAPCSARSAST